MVNYTLTVRCDSHDMLIEISRDVQMPALPRKGEDCWIGSAEEGEYCTVANVWHYPLTKIVEVEVDVDELWVILEIWKLDGWKITENTNKEKFFYYLQHPEDLKNI